MSTLILAEHDNAELKQASLHAVTAAADLGQDIHVLVAGSNCASVAEAAAKVAGVASVLHADDAAYEHGLAENLAPLMVSLADDYDYLMATATTFGKSSRVTGCFFISDLSGCGAEGHSWCGGARRRYQAGPAPQSFGPCA